MNGIRPRERTGQTRRLARAIGIVALLIGMAGPSGAQSPQPLGVVIALPATLVPEVKALNEGPMPYLVTTLHTSPATVDFFAQPVATVRIVPADPSANPSATVLSCRLPRAALKGIQQINNNVTIVEREPGNEPVATVDIAVSNQSHALDRTRFLMMPLRFMSLFLQQNQRKNVRIVYITQGSNVEWVALLAIDQADAEKLQVPVSGFGLEFLRALVLLNANVAVGPTGSSDGVLVTTFEVS
jgi:hypothetical protein